MGNNFGRIGRLTINTLQKWCAVSRFGFGFLHLARFLCKQILNWVKRLTIEMNADEG